MTRSVVLKQQIFPFAWTACPVFTNASRKNLSLCLHINVMEHIYDENKNELKLTISAIRGSSGLGSAMSS